MRLDRLTPAHVRRAMRIYLDLAWPQDSGGSPRIRVEDFDRVFREDGVHAGDLLAHPMLVAPHEECAARFPDLLGWSRRIRVQTVARESNPGMHEILTEFESWTGVPLLAATPFRLPNEPLVSSPLDALRAFRLLGADHAALGRYLVANDHVAQMDGNLLDADKPALDARESW